MHIPSTFPLDVSKLTKGQNVPATECAGILGTQIGTAAHQLKLLGLRDTLMKLSYTRGEPLSIRIVRDGLHINTDAEASVYHADIAAMGEGMMIRHLGHMGRTVDLSKLTSSQQDQHVRSMAVLSMKVKRMQAPAKLEGPEMPRIEGAP